MYVAITSPYLRDRGVTTNLGAICDAPTEALAEASGPRGCRWIEELTVKGVGAFALANGDQRRPTEW